MADLDDFFARKDKAKKGKGGGTGLTKKASITIPSLNNTDEHSTQDHDSSTSSSSRPTDRKASKGDPILNVKIGDEVSERQIPLRFNLLQ